MKGGGPHALGVGFQDAPVKNLYQAHNVELGAQVDDDALLCTRHEDSGMWVRTKAQHMIVMILSR